MQISLEGLRNFGLRHSHWLTVQFKMICTGSPLSFYIQVNLTAVCAFFTLKVKKYVQYDRLDETNDTYVYTIF